MEGKRGLISISFIALLCACFFQLQRLQRLKLVKEQVSNYDFTTIPSFEFSTLKGQSFTNFDLPDDGKAIIFMYLDPDCEECISMIKKINRYYSEFENTHLYLISETSDDKLEAFSSRFELVKHPNINLLLDNNQVCYKRFKLISTPSFIVCNSKQNVVKVIDEEFNFSIVIKYVREAIKS